MDAFCLEEARALSALSCSRCDQPFSLIAGIRSLSFHCPLGHSTLLSALARRRAEPPLEALEDLSLAWEGKLRSLRAIAAQAGADGYSDLASNFHREIALLQSRQEALWNELGAAELRNWRQQSLATGA